MALLSWTSSKISWGTWRAMVEAARALEDGPALEPTNRLRGLAAVEDSAVTFGEALAMNEMGKVRAVAGNSAPADGLQSLTGPTTFICLGHPSPKNQSKTITRSPGPGSPVPTQK